MLQRSSLAVRSALFFALPALALPAFALPTFAQTPTVTPLTAIQSGVKANGVSADGQWFAGGSASGVSYWVPSGVVWSDTGVGDGSSAHISDDGAFVSANLPDPSNGNASTAARFDRVANTWTVLGGLAGQSGTSKSTAYDMSGDGQTIVGLAWVTAGEAHAFRWTSAGGLVDLAPNFGFSSRANGVSRDGQAAVGWYQQGNRRAVRWMGGVQTFLGSLDPANPVLGQSEAFGANVDGSVVVGTSKNDAFRWTAAGGMQNLGRLPGTASCTLVAASDDGETLVGWSGTNFLDARAVVWRPEYGSTVVDLANLLTNLGQPNAGLWSMRFAADVSADGTVVTGWGVGPNFPQESFRIVLPRGPLSYCTAGTTSNGCQATMSVNAQPSASFATPCNVTVSNVEGARSGLVFFSVSGQNNLPWAPGSTSFFCVKTPVQRTPVQSSGGTAGTCTGSLQLDWNAFRMANPTALGNPWSAGQKTWMQGWFRDPPATKTTNTSDALELIHVP